MKERASVRFSTQGTPDRSRSEAMQKGGVRSHRGLLGAAAVVGSPGRWAQGYTGRSEAEARDWHLRHRTHCKRMVAL
jgi:hypothetical protein